jgi:hypothetical protein
MPGLDRTGPLGRGPMTGGRRGRCVLPREPDEKVEEGSAPVLRGVGRGGVPWGCGRGFRRGGRQW